MSEELSFETYLSISNTKFEIYLLDKKNLKNIYKEEINVEKYKDFIDYNLLSKFLDKNIFKIEKLIGKFIKKISIIIENNKILNLKVGIKKKNDDKTISKSYLESTLTEVKDLFKENYQDYKIMHVLLNKYLIDGVQYSISDKDINGENLHLEMNFISLPLSINQEINIVLQKYQIIVDHYFDGCYVKNFFGSEKTHLSLLSSKLRNGENENEIALVPKSFEKKGFFEKFFQFFG
tara:strand:+ start:672 stop:1376 length:705 start_codon:yes stop_codon:yes gene_type:complete